MKKFSYMLFTLFLFVPAPGCLFESKERGTAFNHSESALPCCLCWNSDRKDHQVWAYDQNNCSTTGEMPHQSKCHKILTENRSCSFVKMSIVGGGYSCAPTPIVYLEGGTKVILKPPQEDLCKERELSRMMGSHANSDEGRPKPGRDDYLAVGMDPLGERPSKDIYCSCERDADPAYCSFLKVDNGTRKVLARREKYSNEGCSMSTCNRLFPEYETAWKTDCPWYSHGSE